MKSTSVDFHGVISQKIVLLFNYVTFVQFITFFYDMSLFMPNHLLHTHSSLHFIQSILEVCVQHPPFPDIGNPLRRLRYADGWCGLLQSSRAVLDTYGLTTCEGQTGRPTYLDKSQLCVNSSTKNLIWTETRTKPGPPR
jgi:hypothetical protein